MIQQDETIDILINKLLELKDENGNKLIQQINKKYINELLDRESLNYIEIAFNQHNKTGVDIVDFVKIFLQCIQHEEHETIYYIISLIAIFKDISSQKQPSIIITYQDLTNYLTEDVIQSNIAKPSIQTLHLPDPKMFNRNPTKIRDIDIVLYLYLDAPIVLGDNNSGIKRLIHSKIVTDSVHHKQNMIKKPILQSDPQKEFNQKFQVKWELMYTIKRVFSLWYITLIGAVYSNELNRVFTLDQLNDYIAVYDQQCKLLKKIQSTSTSEQNLIFLNFSYSERQGRLGACSKEYTLSFWEKGDFFEFEKCFSTANVVQELQQNIWYIDFLDKWLTTDQTNSIQCWDIEKEQIEMQFGQQKIKACIVDIIEIPHIKLIGVGSQDKVITFWNVTTRTLVLTIQIQQGGVHSLVFFNSYQVLITAGYKNEIQVFQINPVYFDSTEIDQLIGHNTLVTAIQVIEKTPMVVSGDDGGMIKIWDIRTFYCLQTISLGCRTSITTILDMHTIGKIGIVGSRLYVIEFEEKKDLIKLNQREEVYPLRIEYNGLCNELILCTRRDIRVIDMSTGAVKKIYQGIVQDGDEITVFRYFNQNQKFIVGNNRGDLKIYSGANGEFIRQLVSHNNEVSALKIDFSNRMIISSSLDSMIYIQQEGKVKSVAEITREIYNVHYNKQINLLELSVYHNVFATSYTSSNEVYLWDYEYIRPIGCVYVPKDIEPTALSFINGYNLLVIAANNGKIYFVQFKVKDFSHSDLILYTEINISNIGISTSRTTTQRRDLSPKKQDQQIDKLTKIQFDSVDEGIEQKQDIMNLEETQVQINNENTIENSLAFMKIYNISTFSSQAEQVLMKRQTTQYKSKFSINLPSLQLTQLDNADKKDDEINIKDEIAREWCTQFHVELIQIDEVSISDQSMLLISTNTGEIQIYNLKEILRMKEQEYVRHVNTKLNYNAYRKLKEDFIKCLKNIEIDKLILKRNNGKVMRYQTQRNKVLQNQFVAHRDILTTLSVIQIPQSVILTSSFDCKLKIFELNGTCIGSYNINHPLPIQWNIQQNEIEIYRSNVIYSLKILEILFKRYNNVMLYSEQKKFNITNFLNNLLNDDNGIYYLTQKSVVDQNKKNVKLMRDEYSPRDIAYKNIKNLYQEELTGPSLKQMETNKRLLIAMKLWKPDDQLIQEELQDKLEFDEQQELIRLSHLQEIKDKEIKNYIRGYTSQQSNLQIDSNMQGNAGYIQQKMEKFHQQINLINTRSTLTRTNTNIHIHNNNNNLLNSSNNNNKFYISSLPQEHKRISMQPAITTKNIPKLANSTKSQNFYSYAASKQLLYSTSQQQQQQQQNTSQSSTTGLIATSTIIGGATQKLVAHRKNSLQQIINQLNLNLKKSQVSYQQFRDTTKIDLLHSSTNNNNNKQVDSRNSLNQKTSQSTLLTEQSVQIEEIRNKIQKDIQDLNKNLILLKSPNKNTTFNSSKSYDLFSSNSQFKHPDIITPNVGHIKTKNRFKIHFK